MSGVTIQMSGITVQERSHRLQICQARRRQVTKISFRRICVLPTAISFLNILEKQFEQGYFRPQIKSLNH